ncbi:MULTISPECIES: hypothetical protein [unclassified Sphingopyxis]|uniref:hypothetical protein n=1 Tax=unclassified Sphingopyxis TaxID=2614943 RepID=UPI000A5E1BC1|nr:MULTISPECIES: hypothetical protein [unclassified Sphingopyxis]
MIYLALGLAVVELILRSLNIAAPADIVVIAFLFAMLLGAILLVTSSVRRIAGGEVKLRPQLALRSAPLIFLIILALRFLLEAIFGDPYDNWLKILMVSVLLTILFSLSWTAYRRAA